MKPSVSLTFASVAGALVLAGCTGLPAPGEKQARRDLGTVTDTYRPDQKRPELPVLTPDAGLSNIPGYVSTKSFSNAAWSDEPP